MADDDDEVKALTAGKKAAAVRAERRSRYLFRVLVVFIIGVVRVRNDIIVGLEGSRWFRLYCYCDDRWRALRCLARQRKETRRRIKSASDEPSKWRKEFLQSQQSNLVSINAGIYNHIYEFL